MYARRMRPGIRFDAARALIAEYAADLARLEDLSGRVTAFRLSCCFERLKRSGRFEDVLIDDPFDPEGTVSVKLNEAEWRPAELFHYAAGGRLWQTRTNPAARVIRTT